MIDTLTKPLSYWVGKYCKRERREDTRRNSNTEEKGEEETSNLLSIVNLKYGFDKKRKKKKHFIRTSGVFNCFVREVGITS